jgi:hypothetical protein
MAEAEKRRNLVLSGLEPDYSEYYDSIAREFYDCIRCSPASASVTLVPTNKGNVFSLKEYVL